MDIASRHPAVEGAAGTVLAGVGTAIHFANDWLTPALSFGTALIGFLFSCHAAWRWWSRRKHQTRRKDDTSGTSWWTLL